MMSSSPVPATDPALVALLHNTMSAHQETRLAAEKNLQVVSTQPGFLPALLAVVANGSDSGAQGESLRKAAAIYCKNEVEKRWMLEEADGDRQCITPHDKEVLKEMVVPALLAACKSASSVVPLLKATIHRMVRNDFPKKWPMLLSQVLPLLQSTVSLSDTASLQTGLLLAHEVVSWKGYDSDELTEQIFASFCPLLLHIGQSVLPAASESEQAAALLKMVLKTAYSCISFKYNPYIMGEQTAVPWITFITQALQLTVPERLKTRDMEDEERAELPLFKAKKWALHCQIRIFQRHGCPDGSSFQPTTSAWSFSKFYMHNMAQPVVSVIMSMLSQWQDSANTDRIFCLLCDFLCEFIRNKNLFNALLPHLPTVLLHFAFPKLCFSDRDQQQWEDDPMEYVRSMLDPFDDFYNPAANAANLFLDMVKARKKHIFPIVLHQISTIMNDPNSHPRQRDGCFFLIGTLSKQLTKSGMTEAIEQLISLHILPCLKNSNSNTPAYLKVRAMWTVQQFNELKFKNQETVLSLLQAVLAGLQDTANLPVQVQSACTLGDMLDQQVVQQALPQVLAPVVESILSLNSKCEVDSLAMVLEKLVSMFSSELAPFAVQLCASLRDTAVRICGQAQLDPEYGFADFEENGTMMALVGMLRTIVTLVDSMADSPQLLAALEDTVSPLLVFLLEHKIHDVYDEVFELVESLTFNRKAVSPGIWKVVEHLVLVLVPASDLDYIDDVCMIVDNAVTFDADQFWSKQTLLKGVCDLVGRVLNMSEEDSAGYSSEMESCLEMMEAVLLSPSANHNHQVVSMFAGLAMSRVHQEKCDTDNMTIQHLEVVLAAFIADSKSIITLLSNHGWSESLIAKLSLLSSKFVRVHDKRLLIAGISSILNKIPLSELPHGFAHGLTNLLTVYAEAIESLPKAMAARKKLQEEAENDTDEDASEYDFDSDDYEDLDAMEERQGQVGKFVDDGKDSFGDDDDEYNYDDDEYEEDVLEENIYYESALDKVDIAGLVQSSLVTVARHQPGALQSALSGLSEEHQKLIMSIIQ